MAYTFVNADNDRILGSGSPISAPPMTMSCWFSGPDDAALRRMFYVYDASSTNNLIGLSARWDLANNPLQAIAWDGSGGIATSNVNNMVASQSMHALHRSTGTANWQVYLDGTAGSASGTTVTVSGLDTVGIGRWGGNTPQDWEGELSECAIWNVALDTAEIAELAAGISADQIRTDALQFYAPLVRDVVDIYGIALTNTGAVVADHPRILEQSRRLDTFSAAAAVAGANPKGPLGMPFHGSFGGPLSV